MEVLSTFQNMENDESKMEYLANLIGEEDIATFKHLWNDIPQELLRMKAHGFSIFHVAAIMNRPKFVSIILDAGVDIDNKEKNGSTALHAAAMQGNFTVVKLLVEHNADILLKANDGENVIDSAKRANHPDVVEFLSNQLKEKNLKDDGKYNNLTIEQMRELGLLLLCDSDSDSNPDSGSDSDS